MLILWASWAEVDIIASAQGKIVPSGKVKIIQPFETGVVKTIFVKEGQHIKAGDKLIALDSTSSQADVDRLSSELQGYIDDLARQKVFLAQLNATANLGNTNINDAASSDIQSTAVVSSMLPAHQRLLLESVWQEYQSKLNSFTSEITKLTAEKKSVSIDVGRIEKILPLVIERERSYYTLLETSAVSRNQYLELKQQRIDPTKTGVAGVPEIVNKTSFKGFVNFV